MFHSLNHEELKYNARAVKLALILYDDIIMKTATKLHSSTGKAFDVDDAHANNYIITEAHLT